MKAYFFFALFIFCGLSSCKKAETKKETHAPFDENIKIRMSETVDSTKRTLLLTCFTEKIYECANYFLQTTYSLTSDKITINFIKVIKPNICLTSFGPATALISLEGLSNKVYEVELNFDTTKITGQLTVSDSSFKAILPVQTKAVFVNPALGRIPYNTIYGAVGYPTALAATIVQQFIDSLQSLGATPTLYPPGDYFVFQIDTTGQIKQIQDPGYYFTRYYIFHYINNSQQLKKLVRQFGIAYPDSLTITLNTTKGETFYSWQP